MRRAQVLLVFVDGLGLGERDPVFNPVVRGACPTLQRLMDEAVPLDAGLGVPGIPQSATGQTALLTGINAARAMGRHVEGFPPPALRKLLQAHNIFAQLAAAGRTGAFANAYYVDDIEEVRRRRHLSATSIAALEGLGGVRTTERMLAGQAVYHDLTRDTLRARGYTGPLIAPVEAAEHLLGIAHQHDFTLFEYFMTDRAGHDGHPEAARRVLSELDAFLAALVPWFRGRGGSLLLTSDHGNIEDARSRGHTANPVPLVAIGEAGESVRRRARSILDVVPALLDAIPAERRPATSVPASASARGSRS